MIRRYFLRFLAVTPLAGLAAVSTGTRVVGDDIHKWKGEGSVKPISVLCDSFPRMQWQYRVRDVGFLETLDQNLANIINEETADGSTLVCMSSAPSDGQYLTLRRLVLEPSA